MKILSDRFDVAKLKKAQEIAPDVNFVSLETPEDLEREIVDAVAVYGPKIGPELLVRAKKLRWIQTSGVGTDLMLFPEFLESDIILTNTPGSSGIAIAEHVMAFILNFARNLNISHNHQLKNTWSKEGLEVIELEGRTIGIIGFGGVGFQVAKRAQAFDMRVLAINPRPREKPDYVESIRTGDRLHEVLEQSDFVVLTCPYTPETHGLIGEAEFRVMKNTAFIVNIARGKIIDPSALIAALEKGEIGGAGLDVTDPEPLPPDSRLWKMDNVIITAHYSGRSRFSPDRKFAIFCENLKRFLAGEPLLHVFDRERGY